MLKEKKNHNSRKRFSKSIQVYIRKEKAKFRKESLNQAEYYQRVRVLYQRFTK